MSSAKEQLDTLVIGNVVVRPSTIDVQAVVAIYPHHLRNGLGTFDLEPLHHENIWRRRKNMMKLAFAVGRPQPILEP